MLQSRKLVLALDWTPNTNHSVSSPLLSFDTKLHELGWYGSPLNSKLSTAEASANTLWFLQKGFYLGIAKGWYAEAGIDLDIQSPSEEYSSRLAHCYADMRAINICSTVTDSDLLFSNYSETPARRVMNGDADLCIGEKLHRFNSDRQHLSTIFIFLIISLSHR